MRRGILGSPPVVLVGLLVLGCGSGPSVASAPTPTARLDADVVGYWQNSNPRFANNWWVITETSGINYGVNRQTGTCIRGDVEILGPETIHLTFGTGGTVQLDLNTGPTRQEPLPQEEGHLMFLSEDGGVALHHRIRRQRICLVDGQHIPDAPYPD